MSKVDSKTEGDVALSGAVQPVADTTCKAVATSQSVDDKSVDKPVATENQPAIPRAFIKIEKFDHDEAEDNNDAMPQVAMKLEPGVVVPESTSTELNIRLQRILGPDPELPDLPTSLKGITGHLDHLMRRNVTFASVYLSKGKPVHPEMWTAVNQFLYILNGLELVDPTMKHKARLDMGLELIFKPSSNYPEDYRFIAKTLYDDFESTDWGADSVIEEEIAKEEDKEHVLSLAASSSLARTATGMTKSKSTSRMVYPSNDDPIYGLNGCMHHILRVQGSKIAVYLLDPSLTQRRSAKVFGHNSFIIGQCWATQMALLRDGAHGTRMGGICGNVKQGAFSIVVSGAYEKLDSDYGDTLFYSGSDSHNNTSNVPTNSNGTQALSASVSSGRPVRVFRSSKAQFAGGPRAGIRYDGLYTAASSAVVTNEKNGAYKRFKFVRCKGQNPIDTSQPDARLQNLFEAVSQGYTRTRS